MTKSKLDWVQFGILLVSGLCMLGGACMYIFDNFASAKSVDAIDKRLEKVEALPIDIAVMKEDVKEIKENVREIKGQVSK